MRIREPKPFSCRHWGCSGRVCPPDPREHYGRQWANATCDTCGQEATKADVDERGYRIVETVPPLPETMKISRVRDCSFLVTRAEVHATTRELRFDVAWIPAFAGMTFVGRNTLSTGVTPAEAGA